MTALLVVLLLLLAITAIAMTFVAYNDYRQTKDGFWMLSALLALLSGTLATMVGLLLGGVELP